MCWKHFYPLVCDNGRDSFLDLSHISLNSSSPWKGSHLHLCASGALVQLCQGTTTRENTFGVWKQENFLDLHCFSYPFKAWTWKVTYQRRVYVFPEIKLPDVILTYNAKITCLISALHLWRECCQRGEQSVKDTLSKCISLKLVTEIGSDFLHNVEFLNFTFNF